MTKLPTLTVFSGAIPDKSTQTAKEFANAVHPFMAFYHTNTIPEIVSFSAAMNTVSAEITGYSEQITEDKAHVNEVRQYIDGIANYKGDYVDGGTYGLAESVTLDNLVYVSKIDNNTAQIVPYKSTQEWLYRGKEKKIYLTSSDIEAESNSIIGVDSASSPVNITLPQDPSAGDTVEIMDISGTFDVNPAIIVGNGSTIMLCAENMTINIKNRSSTLMYINNDWRLK